MLGILSTLATEVQWYEVMANGGIDTKRTCRGAMA